MGAAQVIGDVVLLASFDSGTVLAESTMIWKVQGDRQFANPIVIGVWSPGARVGVG